MLDDEWKPGENGLDADLEAGSSAGLNDDPSDGRLDGLADLADLSSDALGETVPIDLSFPSIEPDAEPDLVGGLPSDDDAPVIIPAGQSGVGESVDGKSDGEPLPPANSTATAAVPQPSVRTASSNQASKPNGSVVTSTSAANAGDPVLADAPTITMPLGREPSTDIPTITIPPVSGTWSANDALPGVGRHDGEPRHEAGDAAAVASSDAQGAAEDGQTRLMPPVPPVPNPPIPESLPLNPVSSDAAGDAPTVVGGPAIPVDSLEDFSEISQTGPIAAIPSLNGAGAGAGVAANAGAVAAAGKSFNPKFVIGGIAAVVAVAALSAGGAFAWNNHQAGQTQAQKLVACQAAYKKYQDAADALQSALSKTASAQKITDKQVADAATVTTLASAVKDAKALDAVEECGTNATVSALTTQTAAANDAAESATKLTSSLTKAADAVTASQTKKTDADRDQAKQDLGTAATDAQTLLDNTAGAVADESTRDALQTALDTANGLLKQDKPNVQSLQDALKALQKASDDVNSSAQDLANQNAAAAEEAAAQQAYQQKLAQQQAAQQQAAADAAAAQKKAEEEAAAKAAADEAAKKAQEEAAKKEQENSTNSNTNTAGGSTTNSDTTGTNTGTDSQSDTDGQ